MLKGIRYVCLSHVKSMFLFSACEQILLFNDYGAECIRFDATE